MTRRALIISNPGEIGAENYCEGVKKDVINYKTFLMSPQGGYWYNNEIVCLEKPSKAVLKSYMDSLRDINYTMIIFCGHGYSYKEETVIELQKDMDLYAYSLKSGAKKRTIILDCCRVNAETIDESIIHEFSAKIEKRAMDGMTARKYYDDLIEQCHDGIVVTYACDLDETAGDDSRKGGYYSYSLLKNARLWSEQPHFYRASKSIVSVHECAAKITREKSGYLQNPQIEKPRITPYFPFVVSV